MDNPLVQPDPGLFIWTILTFLVLLTLLAKFAWGPLLAGAREPSGGDPQVARRCAAGEAGAGAAATRSRRRSSARRASRPRRSSRRAGRRRAAAGRAAAEGAGRSRRHRQERRAPDSARDRARAAADPPRGGRPVGDDRLEDHPAQPDQGRQRAADRRGAQAGRSAPPLESVPDRRSNLCSRIHEVGFRPTKNLNPG